MSLVSIVIPTYNRIDLLEIAVKSILSQTYKDYEILIIDNGTLNENTFDPIICMDKRIKYIKIPEHGARCEDG